jgi:hypothetical protein
VTIRGAGIYGGMAPEPGATPLTDAECDRIMQMLREPAEVVHTSASSCPVCGCDPADPWYCEDCDDPDCPCGESEDDDD